MKTIFKIKIMSYETDKSKDITAYSDIKTAISQVKKLNARYGENTGNPYFMEKAVIK